ncbi:hypothetical protein TYRP_006570 [Tyrophagus putrescentiae]|nr:hypothetical protein TYRP_006570 [Tyrophagus putrescentiae]
MVSQVTPGPKRRGLTTLGHCEHPPTRVSRAERAGPESVGVHSAQVSSGKPQMLKAGVIWLIGTDGLGHNELASCVPSRRTMPINQMTSVNA